MAREKVARTRFTVDEYAKLEADARNAGITVGEFLRNVYFERRGLVARVDSIDSRLIEVEKYIARHWTAQEGQHAQGS